MDETRCAERRRPRMPAGLLGALVLIVAFEGYVARHVDRYTDVAAANWRFSSQTSRRPTKRAGVLILGDSLAKYGLVPQVLEDAGTPGALNLAVCSGHMPASYYVLRKALAAGLRPRAIVVDCQDGPTLRSRAGDRAEALTVNRRNWPELLSVAECFELAFAARDAGFFADTLLAQAVPSWKCRFEMRLALWTALAGRGNLAEENLAAARRNWRLNDGAQVMPPRDGAVAEPAAPAAATPGRFDGVRFGRNELTWTYARRLVALAESRGIAVYWLLPPHNPTHQATWEREGHDDYDERFARGLQREHPGLVVIDARHSAYPHEVFTDDVHLDRRGATTLSRDLGAVLAAGIGAEGPRWVALPAYRPLPEADALEDIFRSRVVVREKIRRR